MCVCYFTWSLAYIPWSSSLSSFNFFMASLCYVVNAGEYICKMKIGVWLFPSFSWWNWFSLPWKKSSWWILQLQANFLQVCFSLALCTLSVCLMITLWSILSVFFFISVANIILFWSQFSFLWSCWIFLNMNIFLIFLFLESSSSSLIFLFSISRLSNHSNSVWYSNSWPDIFSVFSAIRDGKIQWWFGCFIYIYNQAYCFLPCIPSSVILFSTASILSRLVNLLQVWLNTVDRMSTRNFWELTGKK